MEWVPSEGIRFYEWSNNKGETMKNRDFFGGSLNRERGARSPDAPKVIRDEPWVFITTRPPGNVIEPHFHEVPQYQLFIEGSGRVGKHGLQPLTVHYTDAYTPYGPIVASDEGLAFMTIRAQTSNGGAFYMPKSRPQMVRKAGRTMTAHTCVNDDATAGSVQVHELIAPTEDGVQARLVSLGAQATYWPAGMGLSRDGFLVVVSGSLLGDGAELGSHSCTFLRAGEPAPNLAAGAGGAQVLVLRFPPPVG